MPTDDHIYVINGFYAAMRSKFTSPGSSIYYFSVSWNSDVLSWADFRANVLGATDPQQAAEGSMRNEIFQRWEALGLPSRPTTGDNGVHGSASAFEGLAERINWLGASLDEDPTGQALLRAGVKKELLKAWCKDPQVLPRAALPWSALQQPPPRRACTRTHTSLLPPPPCHLHSSVLFSICAPDQSPPRPPRLRSTAR